MKYVKYYVAPLLTSILLIGILMGGHWMWMGFVIIFVVMILGDAFLSEDPSKPEYDYPWLLELPLHMALPFVFVLLVAFAWSSGSESQDFLNLGEILNGLFSYDFLGARSENGFFDYLGALLGVGFMVSGYGTVVGHDLSHRTRDKKSVIEARWLLSASCNADFAIEHVYGHHVTVGTKEDPATARRGENVYAFSIRSTVMGHFSAWKHELNNLRKKGINVFSFRNNMITGYLMSAFWCVLFYIAGGIFGLMLFLGQAVFAKFVLEIVNYMEHYGLARNSNQKIGPEHSWNTNKRMSTMVLFSLTKHSAHHEKPRRKYWKLDPYVNGPQMPFGYLTTLLVCLIPPLWYRVMAPKLSDWDQKYAFSD